MVLGCSVDAPAAESTLGGEAESALRAWRPLVLESPHWVLGTRRSSGFQALARWYDRVSFDANCDEAAPLEGLDALADEQSEALAPDAIRNIARVRWAVRVGEELVHWRRCRADTVGPATALVAASRLELALKGAQRQFVEERPDPE